MEIVKMDDDYIKWLDKLNSDLDERDVKLKELMSLPELTVLIQAHSVAVRLNCPVWSEQIKFQIIQLILNYKPKEVGSGE